jgi:hypothetical protein
MKGTRMKSWILIRAIMLLAAKRGWLRSSTSIAWRLSQFEAQTRFLMHRVWRCLLRGFRPAITLLVLCSILPWSLWGCARHAELPFHIPRATVCMNAPPVHPDAKVSAYHEASNTWAFEDEDDIEDFEEFVQYADIIFLRDATAPSESVAAFPVPYNLLSCDAAHPLIPRVVYSDQRLPHANESALAQAGRVHMNTTIEDASALSRHFFGMPAGSAKKGPEIIPVCTRPPDVDPKAREWLFTTEIKGASYTKDANLYARLRATARRVYVFDANAPAASVLRFAPPYDRLRCPGKPLVGDKSLNNPKSADKKAAFDALVAAVTAKASVSEFGGNGGSDKRTWTSAPDGSGASLSFFEAVVRQMVIGGAFQSGDIDGNLKDANGSRHGITSGKNVGGTDSLAVQLTAGTFLMLKTPLRSVGGLIKKVAGGLKQGACLIIADVKLFPKKLAEQLVERFGLVHGAIAAPGADHHAIFTGEHVYEGVGIPVSSA